MAEQFETLREVGVALDGFRMDVRGQFTTLKWIIGGVTALGVGAGAMLFTKVDTLEEIAAKNSTILERIEKQLGEVASDTGAIRETVQVVQAEPSANSFEGWVGVKSLGDKAELSPVYMELSSSPERWIYYRAE